MKEPNSGITRRNFLTTSAGAVAAAALPLRMSAQGRPKYRRYDVMSPEGQKALASYGKGVEAMLNLPADHPQNWFRNAFIHLMDCPHGNWWFFPWHRGYLGFLERTIRNLSGDPNFAIPYWNWSNQPQVPNSMFSGVLTPENSAFDKYTHNLAVFTSFMKSAITSYWSTLDPAQLGQLSKRGYNGFDDLWMSVTGYDGKSEGISGNMAFSDTCNSRYQTLANPKFDEYTTADVSYFVVRSGLTPGAFYDPSPGLSFSSSKTLSHNTPVSGTTVFSVLEGLPHNKVHNCLGGVGPMDPGPYGCMPNYLSSVDPIFFLHHSNMDRLWDLWTRKQQALGMPILPPPAERQTLSLEPFLFFVDGNGTPIKDSQAGEYLNTEMFDYDYAPGVDEDVIESAKANFVQRRAIAAVKATVQDNTATVSVPGQEVRNHLASKAGASLLAEVTIERPSATSWQREFNLIVGGPEDLTQVTADSPYYAGTMAFFGPTMQMEGMSHDATFVVPLPKTLSALQNVAPSKDVQLKMRVVPAHGPRKNVPALKGISVNIV